MAARLVVCQLRHQRPVTLHPDGENFTVGVELLV